MAKLQLKTNRSKKANIHIAVKDGDPKLVLGAEYYGYCNRMEAHLFLCKAEGGKSYSLTEFYSGMLVAFGFTKSGCLEQWTERNSEFSAASWSQAKERLMDSDRVNEDPDGLLEVMRKAIEAAKARKAARPLSITDMIGELKRVGMGKHEAQEARHVLDAVKVYCSDRLRDLVVSVTEDSVHFTHAAGSGSMKVSKIVMEAIRAYIQDICLQHGVAVGGFAEPEEVPESEAAPAEESEAIVIPIHAELPVMDMPAMTACGLTLQPPFGVVMCAPGMNRPRYEPPAPARSVIVTPGGNALEGSPPPREKKIRDLIRGAVYRLTILGIWPAAHTMGPVSIRKNGAII